MQGELLSRGELSTVRASLERNSDGARALLGDDVGTAKLDEVWENQRRKMTGGYSAGGLLVSDRAAWTDAAGAPLPRSAPDISHPEQLLQLTASGGVPWIAGDAQGDGATAYGQARCRLTL